MLALAYPYELGLLGFLVAAGVLWLLVSTLWTPKGNRPRLPRHPSRGGRN